jgi:hypothetical protein
MPWSVGSARRWPAVRAKRIASFRALLNVVPCSLPMCVKQLGSTQREAAFVTGNMQKKHSRARSKRRRRCIVEIWRTERDGRGVFLFKSTAYGNEMVKVASL